MRAVRYGNRPVSGRSDPAPSRLEYRMQRLRLTPAFHRLLRLGVPLALVLGVAGWIAGQPELRAELQARALELRTYIEQRPEFMVHMLQIDGASPELVEDVREVLPVAFPVSSFELDLEALRAVIAELDAVARVQMRVEAGGVLEVEITERIPAVVWQTRATLDLLDNEGHRVGPIEARVAHAKLPLVVGAGANAAVPEALSLLQVAQPLSARLIGLQRIGERRWDVVLTDEQRIMLPPEGAARALQRALAMNAVQDLLARDVGVVDIRLPDRPTLRLRPAAVEAMWEMRALIADEVGQ